MFVEEPLPVQRKGGFESIGRIIVFDVCQSTLRLSFTFSLAVLYLLEIECGEEDVHTRIVSIGKKLGGPKGGTLK